MQHFVAKHGIEQIQGMLDTMARGQVDNETDGRKSITHNGQKAIFDMIEHQGNNYWVWTSFQVDPNDQIGASDRAFNLGVIDDGLFFRTEKPE